MSWQKWVLVVVFVCTTLANVAQLDKTRKPSEPKMQAAGLVVTALLILLVVTA